MRIGVFLFLSVNSQDCTVKSLRRIVMGKIDLKLASVEVQEKRGSMRLLASEMYIK